MGGDKIRFGFIKKKKKWTGSHTSISCIMEARSSIQVQARDSTNAKDISKSTPLCFCRTSQVGWSTATILDIDAKLSEGEGWTNYVCARWLAEGSGKFAARQASKLMCTTR